MNWLDVVALVVCGLAALFGFRVGFVRMLVPLVVIVAGLALSSRLAGDIGNLFSPFTSNQNTQTIVAFFTIFLALFILGMVLSVWLRIVLRFIPFSGLANGVAGALVGLAVGLVLLAGLLIASQKFAVGNIDGSIQESPLASALADNLSVVIRAVGLIPGDWDTSLDGLKESLPDNIPISLPDTLPKGVTDTIPNLLPTIN